MSRAGTALAALLIILYLALFLEGEIAHLTKLDINYLIINTDSEIF